ncbi:MAG: hypothetical protein ACK4ON_09235, partial [Bacteroidia bacterium]
GSVRFSSYYSGTLIQNPGSRIQGATGKDIEFKNFVNLSVTDVTGGTLQITNTVVFPDPIVYSLPKEAFNIQGFLCFDTANYRSYDFSTLFPALSFVVDSSSTQTLKLVCLKRSHKRWNLFKNTDELYFIA